MIRRLDGGSARKLSAGQVITDLSSVLKELLENSLDAGARTVTLRIENYGLSKIIVEDDGSGMALGNLVDAKGNLQESIDLPLLVCRATTKHYLEDESTQMPQVRNSLGFRGEALHCLANLSEVTIQTMTTDTQPVTICITYDIKTHSTSVRHSQDRKIPGTTVIVEKLFHAFPVRYGEFNKNKKKQLLAATSLIKQYALSHPHVRLLMMHCTSAQSPHTTLVSTTGTNDTQRALAEAYGGRYLVDMTRVEWVFSFGTLTGFVSKGGTGRFSADMQILALDGRLVDIPVISRAISDAYAECQPNAAQRVYPVFFLHLTCSDSVSYDVNLMPNKRKVFFVEESKYAEEVRARALLEFRASTEGIDVDRHVRIERTQRADWKATQETKLARATFSATALTQFTYRRVEPQLTQLSSDGCSSSQVEMSKLHLSLYNDHTEGINLSGETHRDGTEKKGMSSSYNSSTFSEGSSTTETSCDDSADVKRGRKRGRSVDSSGSAGSALVEGGDSTPQVVLTDETNRPRPAGPRATMRFPSLVNLAMQPLTLSVVGWKSVTQETKKKHQAFVKITEQTENDLAMHLDKSSFKEMIVHGQFNHGFILASFGDDMFVIDQHAADEKFNYECLMSQYTARPQPLVAPVAVPMGSEDVDLAVDHSEELRQHGFIVRRGEDANKLLVLSVPVLQYEVVGPHDVMELVQQLALYGSITKPLRSVWHSIATKACRSSIMIGTVLSERTMQSVVNRLGDLEQPWNCPHGRPTLRHVACVSSLMSE